MNRFVFKQLSSAVFGSAVCLSTAVFALGQSPLQDQPTPIIRSEIEATIKARDVGDARLTTHYYWFDGAQGDVFINWTSKNFAGDVDLFIQNGLRPLSKIVVYADFGEVETGRVIYLRKPERLLLRVQGRTPNDDAATYRLKFAGSFVAASANEKDVPVMPTVGESVTGAVRVNSVGTILPPPPKPVETKSEEQKSATPLVSDKSEPVKTDVEKQVDENTAAVEEKKDASKLEVIVEDNVKKVDPPKSNTANRSSRRTRPTRNAPVKTTETKAEKSGDRASKTRDTVSEKAETGNDVAATQENKTSTDKGDAVVTPKATLNVDPLANVQLVIVFKDGRKIERPLPEVFRFSVDRGVLTVVAKDGRIGKYQMVDVARVTIE